MRALGSLLVANIDSPWSSTHKESWHWLTVFFALSSLTRAVCTDLLFLVCCTQCSLQSQHQHCLPLPDFLLDYHGCMRNSGHPHSGRKCSFCTVVSGTTLLPTCVTVVDFPDLVWDGSFICGCGFHNLFIQEPGGPWSHMPLAPKGMTCGYFIQPLHLSGSFSLNFCGTSALHPLITLLMTLCLSCVQEEITKAWYGWLSNGHGSFHHSGSGILLPGKFIISSVMIAFPLHVASSTEPHLCLMHRVPFCPRNFAHAIFSAWNAFVPPLLPHSFPESSLPRLLGPPHVRSWVVTPPYNIYWSPHPSTSECDLI